MQLENRGSLVFTLTKNYWYISQKERFPYINRFSFTGDGKHKDVRVDLRNLLITLLSAKLHPFMSN